MNVIAILPELGSYVVVVVSTGKSGKKTVVKSREESYASAGYIVANR